MSVSSTPSSSNNFEENVEAELREIMTRFNIDGPLEKFNRSTKMSHSNGSYGQSQSLTQLPMHPHLANEKQNSQGIHHINEEEEKEGTDPND